MITDERDSKIKNLLSFVRVRLLMPEDLPALEWDGEYIHFRRLYADIFRRYEQGEGLMWVAELFDSKVIGQLFVSLSSHCSDHSNDNHCAYVYGFRIRPPYRNQGIGTYMMQVVEADLSQKGFRFVTLNVAKDNPNALRLYEKLGYHIRGYEPGKWSYIDHQGKRCEVIEPAWQMEKELTK
jgi:ribosomal protein S18 acetylase RimI-like enzyme